MLATGASPVPERATDWGLLAAVSATITDAVRVPAAAGLKVTLMVHFAPDATELPQLLDWVKSLAFAPETATPVTFKVPLPVLERVIARTALAVLRGWLPRARLDGETLTFVVAMVPESATELGLPVASSLSV